MDVVLWCYKCDGLDGYLWLVVPTYLLATIEHHGVKTPSHLTNKTTDKDETSQKTTLKATLETCEH